MRRCCSFFFLLLHFLTSFSWPFSKFGIKCASQQRTCMCSKPLCYVVVEDDVIRSRKIQNTVGSIVLKFYFYVNTCIAIILF